MRKCCVFTYPVIIVFFTLACREQVPLNYEDPLSHLPNDSLIMTFQDTLFFDGADNWVLFDTLYQDSRCPTGVVCLWMGNANPGFQLNGTRLMLNTHPDFPRDTTLQQYRITLLNVMPYPVADSVYSGEDYSTALRIQTLR